MYKRVKVPYNASESSVPVPIIAHSNEVIINVDLAKKIYPYLKRNENLPYNLRNELKNLFETTNMPK
jgi:hypothetical protein